MEEIRAYYDNGYSQYPEDVWDIGSDVENANDVFEFMRECHIMDAHNRNDFPLCSHWGRRVDFFKHEYEMCNLGHRHYSNKTKIMPPSFYDEGKEMYKKWEERINRTIPHLRNTAKKRNEEEKEKLELKRLNAKYN